MTSELTDQAKDLGRRIVRCLRLDVPGGQVRDHVTGIQWLHSDEEDWNAGGAGSPVPNTDDDATRGWLLGQVRKAVADCYAVAMRVEGIPSYKVRNPLGRRYYGQGGMSEAEALVSALVHSSLGRGE
jgi:hypothetical protein